MTIQINRQVQGVHNRRQRDFLNFMNDLPHWPGNDNTINEQCWPKFKVRLLERAKLDSFGRARLDTLSSRKGRGAIDFQAISH